ncbi:MAG TPA: hypothetical protein VMV49_12105 [Candidatus Deferrimicrobium sp.]|nr:hypothetical protein [Candidatus Deferrimicrobium sp.]
MGAVVPVQRGRTPYSFPERAGKGSVWKMRTTEVAGPKPAGSTSPFSYGIMIIYLGDPYRNDTKENTHSYRALWTY